MGAYVWEVGGFFCREDKRGVIEESCFCKPIGFGDHKREREKDKECKSRSLNSRKLSAYLTRMETVSISISFFLFFWGFLRTLVVTLILFLLISHQSS